MSLQFNRMLVKGENDHVASPFASTTSSPQVNRVKISWPLWFLSGVLLLATLGNLGFFAFKYLNDPYRTMVPFSVDEYFADYLPLTGGKFKADIKVSADLGWKEDTGRLMVFTVGNDIRPVCVLIPPKLSAIFFTKGQTYIISLEVNEGGLLYVDSCDKK